MQAVYGQRIGYYSYAREYALEDARGGGGALGFAQKLALGVGVGPSDTLADTLYSWP